MIPKVVQISFIPCWMALYIFGLQLNGVSLKLISGCNANVASARIVLVTS